VFVSTCATLGAIVRQLVNIKYRYHITDPEPPPSITRIGTNEWRHYSQSRGGRKHWDWGDRWERVPCAGMGHGTVMTNGDKRKEERESVRWGWGALSRRRRRSYHRGHRVGKLCHPVPLGSESDYPNWDGHYHWWNGDKMRHWGSLRGAELRFDLDAYRRMHTMYTRRRKKKRK